MEALFPESPHFLEQLRHLGSANQDEVVATFIALAKSDVNPEKDGKLVHKEVLSVILERVAFFPMKPAVMEVRGTLTAFPLNCNSNSKFDKLFFNSNGRNHQAELSRLGLSSTTAGGLAAAWASIAKTVVTARRKVQTNLVGVAAEVRRQMPEGTESLVVSLQLAGEACSMLSETSSGRRVNLRLDPQQAFALYEQLEAAQAGIDAICQ